MDWNKLRTFYHVASVGSFSKAAESLNITQSALSRQVIDLEYSLKKTLFFRRPRGLELTKDGEILYETARKVCAEIEAGEINLYEEETVPKGLLKLCTTPDIATYWLSNYLPGFLTRFPEIRVAVISSAHPTDYILSKADVSLITKKTSSPDFIQKSMMKVKLKLYASPEYIASRGTPEKLSDLDHHQLLTYGDYIHHPYDNINWILSAGAPAGVLREPYLQVNSMQGLQLMAEAGFGIISLSQENPSLAKANLVPILPEIDGPEIETFLVYPMQLKNSKRVQAFKEYLESLMVNFKSNS
ncbi:MAG: LysR family transcriptional regulator [Alphaproteobacteria bacterium]|nr:LysR family transcriptional regulator [Alphaproteobacteria bacterium]